MSTQPTDLQLGLDAFDTDAEFPEPELDTDESEPWDDTRVLEYLYNGGPDLTTREIANDVFDGEVSREHIRGLLHDYDLMTGSTENLASRLADPETTLGEETPDSDVDVEKFTLRGRDQQPTLTGSQP